MSVRHLASVLKLLGFFYYFKYVADFESAGVLMLGTKNVTFVLLVQAMFQMKFAISVWKYYTANYSL